MLLSQKAVSDLPPGWEGTWVISSMSWAVSNGSLLGVWQICSGGEDDVYLKEFFSAF